MLCVAACAAWGRSYAVGDLVEWSRLRADGEVVWSVWSGGGGVQVERYRLRVSDGVEFDSGPGGLVYRVGDPPTLPQVATHGQREIFDYILPPYLPYWPSVAEFPSTPSPEVRTLRFADSSYDNAYVTVVVPYWMTALALSVMPSVALVRAGLRRCRARRVTVCRVCGYDLRATPDRCPECGTTARGDRRVE